MPARIPGTISGRVIVKKTHSRFAPSVPAALSRPRPTASRYVVERILRARGREDDDVARLRLGGVSRQLCAHGEAKNRPEPPSATGPIW